MDCDDNNATINPGLVEIVGNGSDDNCNGLLNENNALNFDGANDSIVAPFSPNQSLNPPTVMLHKLLH
ncbi:MAG: putative metal-binding motif-containing protein [Bacteroidetes bacterium]|nr:putative metal-binding motif-containing protein [Bacteroidota bacterium]